MNAPTHRKDRTDTMNRLRTHLPGLLTLGVTLLCLASTAPVEAAKKSAGCANARKPAVAKTTAKPPAPPRPASAPADNDQAHWRHQGVG
jgi:hypothetical protein